MAAPYNPPVKNEDFIIYIGLQDMSVSGSFKADPTIVAGDFKVKIGAAAPVNITTLPAVDSAGETDVKITLTAAEMNADNIVINGVDQTTEKEWADFKLSIPTTA